MRTVLFLPFFFLLASLPSGAQVLQQFERLQAPVLVNGQLLREPFTGGMNAPQASAADLNQDGLLDLVLFDRVGFVVLTYINTGLPGADAYRYAPEYACNFPTLNDYAILYDFNRDGAYDIFCCSHQVGTQEIQVYQGFFDGGQLHFKPFYFNYPTCATCNPLYVYYPDADQPGFWNNLAIARSDIPGIEDVDGDGDVDIVAFEFGLSTSLFWMRNTSVESGFGPDSLHFVLEDVCWGRIYESGIERCSPLMSPNPAVCASPLTGPMDTEERHNLHPGASLMLYDQEGDGDMDLVMGGINFDCLAMLTNGGTPGNAWFTQQDSAFPGYDVPAELPIFVGAYYVDLTNDGRKDFLACVNNPTSGEDRNGMWLYANTAPQGHYFELQTQRFLIDRTIDLGTAAHPAFADVNADGLPDMVVGNSGFYTPASSNNARLYLFLNTGTADVPAFSLTDDDWLGFADFAPDEYDFSPAFGDIDNDGDVDLVVGSFTGFFFVYLNQAGPGNPLNLKRDPSPMWTDINPGLSTAPAIIDLNKDGLSDLILGERNGNLNYYENTGSAGAPVFAGTPTLTNLGAVNTRAPNEFVGFSVPMPVQRPDGTTWLLVGTQSGGLQLYRDLAPTSNPFPLESPSWGNLDEGNRSHPALADLDGDGTLDMVVGNRRGGLSLFRTELADCTTSTQTGPEPSPVVFTVWPNPATDKVWVSTGAAEPFLWRAGDVQGRIRANGQGEGPVAELSVGEWAPGVYLLEVQTARAIGVVRLVKTPGP